MKKQTKKTAAKKTITPKLLDEQTSAIVIAEYLAIEKVTAAETTAVTEVPHALSYREIAIAFRISEVLDIAAPFKVAPRYQLAFDRAREYHVIRQVIADRQRATAQTETRS